MFFCIYLYLCCVHMLASVVICGVMYCGQVGIVGGGGALNPQFWSTDAHFWVKIGLKFQSLGKISNISAADPPVLLGQFQHWLWLNDASWRKSFYWQSIGSCIREIYWYQDEWLWPLFRGRLRSCQPLRHIRHCIFRKPFQIEAWFQRTTNRKRPTGNQKVTWPRKVKLVAPIRLEPNISKTTGDAVSDVW